MPLSRSICTHKVAASALDYHHHICQRRKHNWSSKYDPIQLKYRCHKGTSPRPPLVFLHGMLGSGQNWTTMAKIIHQNTDRSVYLPDLRNHGNSPWSNSMSYYDMASDISNFILEKKLGNVNLIGKNDLENWQNPVNAFLTYIVATVRPVIKR